MQIPVQTYDWFLNIQGCAFVTHLIPHPKNSMFFENALICPQIVPTGHYFVVDEDESLTEIPLVSMSHAANPNVFLGNQPTDSGDLQMM